MLSWIICNYVPFVSDQPSVICWQSMLANTLIKQYMTNSDLNFTIIVVEHYMMNWRRLIHYKWETGHLPPFAYCKQTCGFLYKHGIDREVATK